MLQFYATIFIGLVDTSNNLHNTTIKQGGWGVEIQQSSRGNDLHVIVILIFHGVVALFRHPTAVGFSVCH